MASIMTYMDPFTPSQPSKSAAGWEGVIGVEYSKKVAGAIRITVNNSGEEWVVDWGDGEAEPLAGSTNLAVHKYVEYSPGQRYTATVDLVNEKGIKQAVEF
jgi:hypothetical protein